MKTRFPSSLWLSAAAVILASCAAEQPPISRVQPDSFDKEFFVGRVNAAKAAALAASPAGG